MRSKSREAERANGSAPTRYILSMRSTDEPYSARTASRYSSTSAKDSIKQKIEDIKGFFKDLVLKIPKPELPELPSFSLKTASKTILGKEITYPVGFDIDWNAIAMNTPKLFTSPTVMQTPYGMLGAGEAGHEIMYGHANLMNDIQNATVANNESLIDGMYAAFTAALQQADIRVEINEREFGRIVREARA